MSKTVQSHNHRDKSGVAKCKVCGEMKTKVRSDQYPNGRYVYRDEAGSRWNRKICPACVSLGRMSPRSKLTDHKNAKGVKSERAVADYFRKQGYHVEITRCHGPDLTLTKESKRLTCEVKSVSKVDNAFYFVSPVYPARRKDDLMAMVFDNGKIWVEPMDTHLLACTRSGRRTITAFARTFLQAK